MSDALRTLLIAAVTLAAGFTWMGVRTAAIPIASPERLVAELRLAQIGALLLALTAGAYVGLAIGHDAQAAAGLDIALAVGFFLVAASTLARDPRHALTIIAVAFAAHAVIDAAHAPGWFMAGLAPRWYTVGGAVFDVYIGVIAYLPILKR